MELQVYTLTTPASDTEGTPTRTEELHDSWVRFSGTFVATLTLQGSNDNSTWFDIVQVVGPCTVPVSVRAKWMRIKTTGYTSGTPAAELTGNVLRF